MFVTQRICFLCRVSGYLEGENCFARSEGNSRLNFGNVFRAALLPRADSRAHLLAELFRRVCICQASVRDGGDMYAIKAYQQILSKKKE